MKLPTIKNFPREFCINTTYYRIKLQKTLRFNGESVLGLCDPETKVIKIKISTPIEMFYTLVHELLHAFEEEYHYRISHKTIYKLEKMITLFLLQNR